MNTTLITDSWKDYELLDSGDGEKLERYGKYILVRPDPKALWHKLTPHEWKNVDGRYIRNEDGGGRWKFFTKMPNEWTIAWNNLTFLLKPTGFKHTGIFPEQTAHWKWMINAISNAHRPINVLNLFAYTGGSTLACLSAGASVTHVDSAKDVITWARRNSELSTMNHKPVRWIPEDAIKYVKREIQRGTKYDAIIMDPPKFGRGANGEVWKIEYDLPRLLELCTNLLTPDPLFVLVNAYAVEYSPITLRNLLSQAMKKYKGSTTSGDLTIKHSNSDVLLPTSIFSYWLK